MSKKVPLRDRQTVVSQIMTTVQVRAQLETLARREKVSVGEIGRRALQEFLAKGKSDCCSATEA
jgi:phage-related baseplate assembly protein